MLAEVRDWWKRIDRAIWRSGAAPVPAWKRRAVRLVRLVLVTSRDVFEGELTLWSMSLVYTTLLSMVPLLAFSFSVLKGFGVHNQIEPLLDRLLAPLGDQAHEITTRLIDFIDHMNVGVLGALGLALLIYTVISLIQKIEEAFNAVWHVTQLRSLSARFSRYLSALLVGPMLVFAALGITAMALGSESAQAMLAVKPLGLLASGAGKLVPYLLVIASFTFLYWFIPNARVRFMPALAAGVVGGVLWQSAGWAFALFIASSTQYAAIYSSFAILLLFLIWLYVSWLVLLVGADIAFYLQHPEYMYALPGEPRLSNRMRERLAMVVMHLVASHFVQGRRPWTLPQLTEHLGIPMHSLTVVLDGLKEADLITVDGSDPPAYLPARDLAQMDLAEVMSIVRRIGEDRFVNPDSLPLPPPVHDLVVRMEAAVAASVSELTVRALIDHDSGT